MPDNYFVISVDRATGDELNNVQNVIKENANGWWHRHTNVWIVGGGSASKWRDLIKPALPSRDSSVLVIKLPSEDADRSWAFSGKDASAKCKWFHENYK